MLVWQDVIWRGARCGWFLALHHTLQVAALGNELLFPPPSPLLLPYTLQVTALGKELPAEALARLVVSCASALQPVWPLRAALFASVFLDGLERAVPD